MSKSDAPAQNDAGPMDAQQSSTQPLVDVASASIAVDTFDSPNGAGFEEWQTVVDDVRDHLGQLTEGQA